MDQKTCRTCSHEKSADEFYRGRRVCKECCRKECRAWHSANKERANAYSRAYKAANPERVTASYQDWRDRNPDYWLKSRKKIIDAYGGKCVVCGETDYEVLQLDHVNGDGNQHRAAGYNGSVLFRWARANGYPPELQLLCANDHVRKTLREQRERRAVRGSARPRTGESDR